MTVVHEDTAEESRPSLELPVLQLRWGRWRRWLVGTTVLLVLASVVLGLLAARARGLAEARDEAVEEATRRLPLLLSYDQAALEENLDTAVAQTTGTFREEYRAVVEQTVRPTAARRKVTTSATVSGAGVVEARRDRVVVLAFLTQATSTAGGAPSVTGSRVEVTMAQVGDTWLISDLEPV